ncbi:hypothetical protein H1C71_037530 [Ictidomys tridecemlineatus]|nr:hypothetical protein H1C71_037530 [Ictidomys tridecemlineatus]
MEFILPKSLVSRTFSFYPAFGVRFSSAAFSLCIIFYQVLNAGVCSDGCSAVCHANGISLEHDFNLMNVLVVCHASKISLSQHFSANSGDCPHSHSYSSHLVLL